MWVPPEVKDPVMLHAPTRQSIACFGAVHLGTEKFVYAFSDLFDAKTFRSFLGQLLRHRSRNKRMVVILDNARYHHARILKEFLKKHRRTLTLLFLPPYSPQLAPIERVWKLARRIATHNQHFPDLHTLISAVGGCFRGWRKSNATLQRLCSII